VAGLAAVVAAAVGAVQTEGGTVSLDVTEALAVVALLGWMEVSNWEFSMSMDSRCSLLSVVRGRGQALDSWPI
jgi:hypothetical protein